MRIWSVGVLAGLLAMSPLSAAEWPPLPVGVSSLGAVACDGYIYVYGGHAGKTHSYDTKSVLGTFQRLKLDGGTKWEELPGGPILQGLGLAAHQGKVYRVGGMTPRNAPGEPTDIASTAECAVFDPKVGRWEPLPPLPAARSSHDLVVAGDTLVVVGGWQSRGKGQGSMWHDTTLTLDLTASAPKWQVRPQPFQRRALTAVAVREKVYVIGGLESDGGAVRNVEVFDLKTGTWSEAPAFPGKTDRVGFSPAAANVNGRVVVSTSAGPLYRLSDDGKNWEEVATASRRRMVHRMIPLDNQRVMLVGGAGGGENVAELEVLTLGAAAKGGPRE